MRIMNSETEDYHVHSLNFSDGMNTVDELVRFAGEIGMTKLTITDHAQSSLEANHIGKKGFRGIIRRWKNIFNNVDVRFGVEADLLNEQGDICTHIDGIEGDFIILSYHIDAYQGDPTRVAEGFVNAIRRHSAKINIIGHVVMGLIEQDAKIVILEANKHGVPLELNAKYFHSHPDLWEIFFKTADSVYINSDAHTLSELKLRRKEARDELRRRGIVAQGL